MNKECPQCGLVDQHTRSCSEPWKNKAWFDCGMQRGHAQEYAEHCVTVVVQIPKGGPLDRDIDEEISYRADHVVTTFFVPSRKS